MKWNRNTDEVQLCSKCSRVVNADNLAWRHSEDDDDSDEGYFTAILCNPCCVEILYNWFLDNDK